MATSRRTSITIAIIVMVVVGGVIALGLYLASRGFGAKPDPSLKLPTVNDHWHANLTVVLCGEEQGVVPAGPGEVHSHGDGKIHIHPHSAATAGARATLGLFFRTHGGKLTNDTIEYPGAERTWRNGDACPDDSLGVASLKVNGQSRTDFDRYVPQDGDALEITFSGG